MRIRVAILEKDSVYLNRIVTAFSTKYASELEIYSFTEEDMALKTVTSTKIDVLIASELFEIDKKQLPERCGFAYLVETQEIETLHNEPTICKFQRAELIYKQILSIYSEHALKITGFKLNSDNATKIIVFSSVSGGAGSSTMAVSCAKDFARQGKKVLYLNMEQFGNAEQYLAGPGQGDMSDIIYNIKSNKSNLTIKLESTIRQDESKVYFIAGTKIALDLLELNEEDVKKLLHELRVIGNYDYIIFDLNIRVEKVTMAIINSAYHLVMVSEGTATSNNKMRRFLEAFHVMEQQKDINVLGKIKLIYNKFSNKYCTILEEIEVPQLGGVPKLEQASQQQIIDHIVDMNLFEKLL